MAKLSKDSLDLIIEHGKESKSTIAFIEERLKVANATARSYKDMYDSLEILDLGTKGSRVLFVGDLHAPFVRDGYLEFCKSIYDKYNLDTVVFAGDILDNHYASYHESDPDGDGAGEELARAREQILEWYETFPNAFVCLGNHDQLPNRKAFSSGLSKKWIRTIDEVLHVPKWKFEESFEIDDVLYCHGIGRKARQRMKQDIISVAQGHYHSESYIDWLVGKNTKTFAMQVGCGMYDKSYAAAYGKHFAKMHINCGVIIGGKIAFLEYMDL